MADRHDFRKIIAEIEESGVTLYKLALMMHRQYVQIQRIKETGRCQHYEGEMLLEIHREIVPRVSLQIVPRPQAIMMQSA